MPMEVHQLNTFHSMPTSSTYHHANNNGKTPTKHHQDEDTDPEDLEDAVGESEDSDAEEDLPLELDDGRSANKKDEMEVEQLATLERLRQTQRQDYLRVSFKLVKRLKNSINNLLSLGFSFGQCTSDRSPHERTP